MKEERTIIVEGQSCTVVISDEQEALLAAEAAGRAIVGLWHRNQAGQALAPAAFIAERLEDIDEAYLEKVVRRKMGLPWMIAETDRLLIREFCMEDLGEMRKEESDGPGDRIFYTPELLKEYIRNQYGFYQYGIWAVVEKASKTLVGKAGVSNVDEELLLHHKVVQTQEKPSLELGYHIFTPYRNLGYAREACRAIQKYVESQMDGASLYVRIAPTNDASLKLAMDCGFHPIPGRCSESGPRCFLYGWNC